MAGIVKVRYFVSFHFQVCNCLLTQLVTTGTNAKYFLILLKGVLDSAGFPAVVTAHFVPVEGQQRPRTTILIKFADEVSFFTLNL